MGRLLDLFSTKYPYTDFHELNASWIVEAVSLLDEKIDNFVALNTIKYSDPIQWNITVQYPMNTVVVDPITGNAYLSIQPVPTGVPLTNTDYWTLIFNLNLLSANQNLTLRDDGANILASFESNTGDWLIWNAILYRVSQHINTNEAYVVGYNLDRYTVEQFIDYYITATVDMIGDLSDLTTTDKTNVVAAVNEIVNNIGDLADLTTTDTSSIVNAINEINTTIQTVKNRKLIYAADFGAVGDGVTDDTQALQDLASYLSTNAPTITIAGATYKNYSGYRIVFNGIYLINAPIEFDTPYCLTLDELRLIADSSFSGSALLEFNTLQRKCILSNSFFDCNFYADTAVVFNKHYVGWQVSNVEIKQFVVYGLYLNSDTTAFEFNAVNLKIEQHEAGNTLPTGIITGCGIQISANNSDNNFSNLIVSYCYAKLLEVNSASNTFINSHFYMDNDEYIDCYGNNNNFIGCYLDGVLLKIFARSSVIGCYFHIVDSSHTAIDLNTNTVGQNIIQSNEFHSTQPGTTAITSAVQSHSTTVVLNNIYERCGSVVMYGEQIPNSQYIDLASHFTVHSSITAPYDLHCYKHKNSGLVTLYFLCENMPAMGAWSAVLTGDSQVFPPKAMRMGNILFNPGNKQVQNTSAITAGSTFNLWVTFAAQADFTSYT